MGSAGYDRFGLKLATPMLFGVTAVVACCSMIYEFLLAQALSATMGDTVLRYNSTIGLFIAAMGAGALLVGRWSSERDDRLLVRVELALSVVGAGSPFGVLAVDHGIGMAAGLSEQFQLILIYALNYGLIALIGVLSGFELPLLMELGRRVSEKVEGRVIAVDYVGMLIGAVSFPLILVPNVSLFRLALGIGLVNALVALALAKNLASTVPSESSRKRMRDRSKGALELVVAIFVVVSLATILLSGSAVEYQVVESLYMAD